MNQLQAWEEALGAINDQGLWRQLQTPQDRHQSSITFSDKEMVNLSSNDYLGLASDARISQDFLETLQTATDGPIWGSTASRFMTGSYSVQNELEAKLAALYPQRQILLMNSGYHANLGVIPALLGPGDAVFCDRLCHASLLDGIRLSGAQLFRYRHGDCQHLADLLKTLRPKFRQAIIATESVFSMDGDFADLATLIQLKTIHNALLLVDEAHSFGVLGAQGEGLAGQNGLSGQVDILVGTFGKALASMGAFVAADPILIATLIQKSRPLIFSTALPPVCTAWVLHLLNQADVLAKRRLDLAKLTVEFRHALVRAGINIPLGQWIVPILCGRSDQASRLSQAVRAAGFHILPIRPPTVPENTARLRISLRADITIGQLLPLAQLLGQTVQ